MRQSSTGQLIMYPVVKASESAITEGPAFSADCLTDCAHKSIVERSSCQDWRREAGRVAVVGRHAWELHAWGLDAESCVSMYTHETTSSVARTEPTPWVASFHHS